MSENKGKKGFANMNAEKRREIASKGGKAAQAKGTHNFTSEEAKIAGKKGGLNRGKAKRDANKQIENAFEL